VDVTNGAVRPLSIPGGSFLSWSPDGSRLVFDALGEGTETDVFTVRADGTERRRLTGEGSGWAPTWSPQGDWVAYLSDRDGGNELLYLVRPDGPGNRRLIFSGRRLGGYSPVWSPDGSNLAVEVYEEGEWNIHVVEVATGRTTQVTAGSGDDISPAWSPDGQWIAYAASPFPSSEEGDNAFTFDIHIVRPDGTGMRPLTKDAGAGAGISWQPVAEAPSSP
jgi:TolB protein